MKIGYFLSLRGSLCVCLTLVSISNARAAELSDAETWQAKTEQWLELERRLADEANSWSADKEVMEASRLVLTREQGRLKERAASNELATQLFARRLHELQGELATQEGAQAQLGERLLALEGRLRALYPRLPEPLRDRLDPLFGRLQGGAPENAVTVSERTQTLVSILSAVDQFNGTVTLTHHLRKDEQGREIDVQVLYWGLAVAYGVDTAGSQAWVLTPQADGWLWRDAAAVAPKVRELVEIYERKRSPGLVSLPAQLTEVQP